MSDDLPRNRAAQVEAAIRQLREIWISGGVDATDPESREEWGQQWRRVVEGQERSDRRHEALAKVLGAIVTALAIGALTTGGPLLLRLLLRQ